MDEATAVVDYKTDELIQQTVREEFREVTVLTIAHRIQTVLQCDKIMAIDEGSVAEFDTPQRLLESKSGIFYEMYSKSTAMYDN